MISMTHDTRFRFWQFPFILRHVAGIMLAGLLVAALPAKAEDNDDQYVQILTLIQQGDMYNSNGKPEQAMAKYRQAQAGLQRLQKASPDWNANLVTYRLNYLNQKVAGMAHPGDGTNASSSKAAGSASKAQVKLLEPGSEPRQVLRLHPKAGDKQTLTMILKLDMNVTAAGAPGTPMKMPGITLSMDTTVKNVSPEGDIEYELVMSDASVADDPDAMPAIVQAMKASFEGLKGVTGTGVMSSRGFNSRIQFKPPQGANAQTTQALDQMKETLSNINTPLPEEAVGAGGRWEAKTKIKSQGMTIDQTATCQVATIEGDHLTLKSTITQNAANQKVQNPSMPGVVLDLQKMTGDGTGQSTMDLTKLLPLEGAVDFHTDSTMAMNMGGQKQTVGMKMGIHLELAGK